MKPYYVFLTTVTYLILNSCSHIRDLSNLPDEHHGTTKIFLSNGETAVFNHFKNIKDSLIIADSAEFRYIPINQIQKIIIKSRTRGLIDGAGLGLASGATVGAMVGASADDNCDECGPLPTDTFALIGAGIYGGVGLILGSIVGVIKQSEITYIFFKNSDCFDS